MGRKFGRFVLSRYVLIILTIFFVTVTWFFNYGTNGPIIFFFLLIQSFTIFIFARPAREIISALLFFIITFLFGIELIYPGLIGYYPNYQSRLVDIYTSVIIYQAINIIIITLLVRFYSHEKEKAQDADRLKTTFLVNMSHEIRTPIHTIIGFSELLRNPRSDESLEKYLEIIKNSSRHLLGLIDNIIDISKIEANQFKINFEDFSVTELIEDLEELLKQQLAGLGKQSVIVVCIHPEQEVWIRSDPYSIRQVMINLLTNAAKFTDKGKIVFGFMVKLAGIEFYVKDTGIGIDDDQTEKIFDPYYKIEHDEKKISRGAGVGLAISRQLVFMLGGSLTVKSEKGVGSHFTFVIPLNQVSGPKKEMWPVIPADLEFENKLILVAEDDETSYLLIKMLLNGINMRSIWAKTGAEALEQCLKNPHIKLVLMDVKMPDMDGLEATRKIKAIKPDLPVIAQTAYADGSDEILCKKAGCDDYISKPINNTLLIRKIKKHLQ
ncbi:MAG: response regulator [Bacteroidetes bacterium]|nr:response regulator [Bacteroidota bacterium]